MKPVAEVLGENCKRLRIQIGATQDEVAHWARAYGLSRWRASSVGDFEAGRSSPTFVTVISVAAALQRAAEERQQDLRVTMADLVDRDGWVALNGDMVVPSSVLRAWLSGGVVSMKRGMDAHVDGLLSMDDSAVLDALRDNTEDNPAGGRSGLAEQRLAKDWGLDAKLIAATSIQLWGRSFTEERDHRAGPDANKQKRGQVTRQIRAELAAALDAAQEREIRAALDAAQQHEGLA